jgi:hypothetical protein
MSEDAIMALLLLTLLSAFVTVLGIVRGPAVEAYICGPLCGVLFGYLIGRMDLRVTSRSRERAQ